MGGGSVRIRVAACLACCVALVRAEPPAERPPPAAADLAAWIEQLGSPQYAQREAAARRLAAAGRPTLAALGDAIGGVDFEVASRSVEIVRGMLVSEDPALIAAAEQFLERLALADDSAVGRLAASALDFQRAEMAAQARARLEEQGAVFRDRRFPVDGGGLEVEFNAAWRGEPEDWRLVSRLQGVVCVSVHGVPLDAAAVAALGRLPDLRRIDLFGTSAPEAAVAALVTRLPDTLIDVRKGGKLGVSSLVQEGPCVLSAVQAGSAADKAGLRPGDVILAADGEPVASFAALTARLAVRGPGDVVRLEVERDAGGAAAQFACPVRLDAW